MKNPQTQELVRVLKKHAIEQKSPFWKRIASDLEKPTRNKRIVNISKLNRYTKENETVIIPGKVLADGELKHKLNIAAQSYSQSAIKKLIDQKCELMTIPEFLQKNPKGKNTRIIG